MTGFEDNGLEIVEGVARGAQGVESGSLDLIRHETRKPELTSDEIRALDLSFNGLDDKAPGGRDIVVLDQPIPRRGRIVMRLLGIKLGHTTDALR